MDRLLLDITDAIDLSRARVRGLRMACSGLEDSDERDALEAIADQAMESLKVAKAMLEEARCGRLTGLRKGGLHLFGETPMCHVMCRRFAGPSRKRPESGQFKRHTGGT